MIWLLLVPSILAGLLALALGVRWLWHRDAAVALCLALAALMFSGNWQYLPGVSALPVKPDRLLLLVALALLLLRAPGERDRPPLRLGRVHIALVAASLYGFASFLWGNRSSADLFSIIDAYGIAPFVVFTCAGVAFRTRGRRDALLGTLVIVGAYLGLTSLFESLHLTALVWPRYVSDPNIGILADRARGPFIQPAANGLAMFACCVASAIAIRLWKRPAARRLAAGVLILCFLGCLLTLTRAVWIGTAVAALAGLLVDRSTRRLVLPLGLTALVAIGIAFATIPGLSASAEQRQADIRPVWDRLNTDDAAVRMLADRPLFGFGWGTFETESRSYLRQADTYPLTGFGIPVHNVFLGNAVALGAIGMSLWLLAWASGIGAAVFRRPYDSEMGLWRAGLVALLLDWFVVANFTPVAYAFPIMLLWLWAGISRHCDAPQADLIRSPRPPWPSAVAPWSVPA